MSSALQLLFPQTEGTQPVWYRPYIENMRPLRDYPNYYRFTDHKDYIDGPDQVSTSYTRENIVWLAKIRRDGRGNNKNIFDVYNLSLDNFGEKRFTYEHTDVIDAVSLEFDQSGQPLILFESLGVIHLRWYDPQQADVVVTELGNGRTPIVCTTSYKRSSDITDSTRLLFYVDSGTNQIVYRKQNDRYGVVYNLPNAPGPVAELLQVSKNLYGGLMVVCAYESAPEEVSQVSFIARDDGATNAVALGTDFYRERHHSISYTENGTLNNFALYTAGVKPNDINEPTLVTPDNGALSNFALYTKSVSAGSITEPTVLSMANQGLITFGLRNVVVSHTTSDTGADAGGVISGRNGTLGNFRLEDVVLSHTVDPIETASSFATGMTLNTLTLQVQ